MVVSPCLRGKTAASGAGAWTDDERVARVGRRVLQDAGEALAGLLPLAPGETLKRARDGLLARARSGARAGQTGADTRGGGEVACQEVQAMGG